MCTQNRSKQSRSALLLSDTQAAQAINIPDAMKDPEKKWHRGKYVVSQAVCPIFSLALKGKHNPGKENHKAKATKSALKKARKEAVIKKAPTIQ